MARLTLSFKGRTLAVYTLHAGETVIGRDASSGIRIDSLAVSPVHARIRSDRQGFTIEQASPVSTLTVNGSQVDEHRLADNDTILVGKHTLIYAEGDARPSPEPPAQRPEQTAVKAMAPGWLQILNGEKVGKTIKLKTSLTDTGKLGLQPALISRRHDGYYISSLSEDTSVTVGDRDIGNGSRALQDGDLIRIGDVELQFYTQPD